MGRRRESGRLAPDVVDADGVGLGLGQGGLESIDVEREWRIDIEEHEPLLGLRLDLLGLKVVVDHAWLAIDHRVRVLEAVEALAIALGCARREVATDDAPAHVGYRM